MNVRINVFPYAVKKQALLLCHDKKVSEKNYESS